MLFTVKDYVGSKQTYRHSTFALGFTFIILFHALLATRGFTVEEARCRCLIPITHMLTQSASCLFEVAVKLNYLTSTVKVGTDGLRRAGFLKGLPHEASFGASSTSHVCLQPFPSFQPINILGI